MDSLDLILWSQKRQRQAAAKGKGGSSGSSYWETRKPSGLIVTGQRDTEIDFSWTDNSEGDCSFAIYRSTDGVNYSSIGTTDAGDTTYTATGLTAGNLYYFYVKGVKDSNESDPTDAYDTRFKITVDTTKAGSADTHFVLPVLAKGTGSYYVDWGDGGAEEEFTTTGNKDHTYSSTGSYQVKVRGVVTRIGFDGGVDRLKVTTLDNWGNIKLSSLTGTFNGCANMQGAYVDVPNTSASMTAVATFNGCAKFNWPVNNFNTASITNMTSMFNGCTIFNQPVNNWNTGNVTLMTTMFTSCPAFNQDISNFNIEKVTSMANMFNGSNAWSRANYDAALIAWAAQNVQNSVAFHAGDATYTAGGDAEAARTHLVTATGSGGHGWTITDGGSSFDNGKLILTSDDGYSADYTVGFPRLVAQGVAATFYINSDNVGGAGRCTWAQLLEMQAAGMDVQCHFNTHTDLRTLNEAQIVAGLQDCASDFTTNSLTAPSHHAYPYGYFNDNVKTYVAEERLTGRTTVEAFTFVNTDKFAIPAIAMDTSYISLSEAAGYLDHAKSEGKAVVLYGHRMGAGGSYIDMDEIDTIIDYAQSIGVDIITMSQLYALM